MEVILLNGTGRNTNMRPKQFWKTLLELSCDGSLKRAKLSASMERAMLPQIRGNPDFGDSVFAYCSLVPSGTI